MGMWDFEAWDNDSAADWFGNLMDATNLREHWLSGIQGDAEDDYEEVRAAVWLFAQLGRTYIWPIDHLDADLELAISAAETLLANQWLQEEVPEFLEKVKSELTELQSRRRQ